MRTNNLNARVEALEARAPESGALTVSLTSDRMTADEADACDAAAIATWEKARGVSWPDLGRVLRVVLVGVVPGGKDAN